MNVHHVMNTELHFGSTQTFDSLNGGRRFLPFIEHPAFIFELNAGDVH